MKNDALLSDYLHGIEKLKNALEALSEKELNFRPDRNDSWTIKEHVIHLVDSETNGFIRCKSIIAQPNSSCYVMDEDTWTANIRYKNEDLGKYVQLFALVRELAYDFIRSEPESNWENNYFVRNYKGDSQHVTMRKYLEIYCKHLDDHIDYINSLRSEYRTINSISWF